MRRKHRNDKATSLRGISRLRARRRPPPLFEPPPTPSLSPSPRVLEPVATQQRPKRGRDGGHRKADTVLQAIHTRHGEDAALGMQGRGCRQAKRRPWRPPPQVSQPDPPPPATVFGCQGHARLERLFFLGLLWGLALGDRVRRSVRVRNPKLTDETRRRTRRRRGGT